jgi:glycerol-3-phosphate acyltransferase PlsY
LGVSWLLGGIVAATWFIIYKVSKISSLSALVSAILTPIYVWFLIGNVFLTIAFVLISIILLWRHKANIERLLEGKEK